jgi:hypothetical protein
MENITDLFSVSEYSHSSEIQSMERCDAEFASYARKALLPVSHSLFCSTAFSTLTYKPGPFASSFHVYRGPRTVAGRYQVVRKR